MYISNLYKKIKLSELEEYIKTYKFVQMLIFSLKHDVVSMQQFCYIFGYSRQVCLENLKALKGGRVIAKYQCTNINYC